MMVSATDMEEGPAQGRKGALRKGLLGLGEDGFCHRYELPNLVQIFEGHVSSVNQ